MKLIVPALMVLMSLLVPPALAQDASKGMDAFNRGDYVAALLAWQPLAVRGDADAQASLGLLYARGHGVPQDYNAAVRWFHESAQQGHALGQNNLGVMYRNGHGVPQDFRMAITLYRLSAAQGYALAQASLGAMYHNGEGTRRDFQQAYMWYTLAAEQGHEGAAKAREALGQLMSADQKSQALALAQKRQQKDALTQVARPPALADPASPSDSGATATVENTPAPPAPPLGEPQEAAVDAPQLAEIPAASPAEETPPKQAGPAWRVQLGSLRAATEAEATWQELQRANQDLLRGLELHVQQAELPRGTYFRVQAGPLADRASAASLCNSLKSRNQDCLIVVP